MTLLSGHKCIAYLLTILFKKYNNCLLLDQACKTKGKFTIDVSTNICSEGGLEGKI